MNPFKMLGAMKNPQTFIQQMMNNSQVMQNPMAKNAMEIAQKRSQITEVTTDILKLMVLQRLYPNGVEIMEICAFKVCTIVCKEVGILGQH